MDITGFIQYAVTNADKIVGFGIPVIVEVLNKNVYGAREKFLVTVSVCVLAAILLNFKTLLYGTPDELIISAGIIFTESQVVYKLYFERSVMRQKIQDKIG